MALYLLVKGVRSSPRDDQASVAEPAPFGA